MPIPNGAPACYFGIRIISTKAADGVRLDAAARPRAVPKLDALIRLLYTRSNFITKRMISCAT
ncbi:hypothetical protein [Burkholderia seminalis]|uniref:hypothetical protein n=1 Tax=Burkholderia seminalis TaxID=488731 RepID=UPI00265225F2|nr:hypothetical protein [Burkholderia seminalis]MDN7850653.1 hypothetical protein [Burkholderia seminalis]